VCRKLKLDAYLSPSTSINLKWIKGLNIRPETLKQPQKLEVNTSEHIGIGNDFLNRTPVAQQIREKMNKWDCIKLKSKRAQQKKKSTAKEPVTRLYLIRDSPQKGRKALPAIHLIRE
jgi:hypothetical protein